MPEEKKIKWKDTLNLPRTDFPMKAQLNRREPELLQKWNENRIYEKILASRMDRPRYILHDGPPYANGRIHLGHAMNKILKDFIVKTKTMENFYSPYVPGWDCHGLPIEHKVDQQLGGRKAQMGILEIRDRCRTYAEKFIGIQREDFARLGIFGDWFNPYTTLDHDYEASIINCFKSFVKKGNVYRNKRPVYWCPSCETALAEAEVEYHNHVSPSIYVKFQLKEIPDVLKGTDASEINVLIWTTTPWTIPANLAIAVNADYDYLLFEMGGEYHIAASRLVPVIADLVGEDFKKITEFKGAVLNGLKTRHPLYERDSLLINTDYVALDQGTGCVHTAPGHGEDDYRAGIEYGLDIYSPVDARGRFENSTGKYEGKNIFAANREISDDLRAEGRLIYSEDFEHSYPHCWRCKNPVIYRATAQWFIAMDRADLRGKALSEIQKTEWLPAWGEERISQMIANRPDWCISRQRDWGVPIPVVYCQSCNEPFLNEELVEKTEEIFRREGSNSWYERDLADFLPEKSQCSACRSAEFKKGRDIIDVWFESGSSWGVIERYPNHHFPADMYLEGGDQYRGWFHSSLLLGISARGEAPYKTVITHGFALDGDGRAMSKSMGNVIDPQAIIKDKGAEILRLWVAMLNYREDTRLSPEILSRVTESYRKVRNTWKFMLGVLSDFDPEGHAVASETMSEVDRFILQRFQDVKQKINQGYRDYEYHVIYHTIANFFNIELSSFYLNIMKDILYCNLQESPQRRAAQTVIFTLLKESLLLFAPILSFTSEEAWELLPDFPGKQESVHMHVFPEIDVSCSKLVQTERWELILQLRDRVQKAIEKARTEDKIIRDSLEAALSLQLTNDHFQLLKENTEMLQQILVVSSVEISQGDDETISISKFSGEKCPRCWQWFSGKSPEQTFPELCPRCSAVVKEQGLDA